jgi:hypothetical protein
MTVAVEAPINKSTTTTTTEEANAKTSFKWRKKLTVSVGRRKGK